jgi:hypothetical protein
MRQTLTRRMAQYHAAPRMERALRRIAEDKRPITSMEYSVLITRLAAYREIARKALGEQP